jgi:hypothetical protein
VKENTMGNWLTDHFDGDDKQDVPQSVEPQPVEVSPDEAPKSAESDDSDVESVIADHTGDGPGDDDVPPADFKSFAADDVEKEDNT